jgi:hypothetical protein
VIMNVQEHVEVCHKSRIMDNIVVLIRMLQRMLYMATVHVGTNEQTFLQVQEAAVKLFVVRSHGLQR